MGTEQRYKTCISATWLIATWFIATWLTCTSNNPRYTMGHIGSSIDTDSVLSCCFYYFIWRIKYTQYFRRINTYVIRMVCSINRWIDIILSSFKGNAFIFLFICFLFLHLLFNLYEILFLVFISIFVFILSTYFSTYLIYFDFLQVTKEYIFLL